MLYYLLPFDKMSNAGADALVAVGLLGVSVLIVWQVRAIIKSNYPAIQAIEALAITTPLFLLLFAATYYLMERTASRSFTQHLSRTDALYFTVTTFSTVGYGDITAKSETARSVVIVQILADLAILGIGIKVIVAAVRMGQQRRAQSDDDGSSPPSPSRTAGLDQDRP
jgi:hypothetical protein